MDEIKLGIQYIFQTRNRLTLAVSASGHGAMEASLGNILEAGETILIVVNGFWGERAINMASRLAGVTVRSIRSEPGIPIDLRQLEESLKEHKPDVVFMVHGESSTGMRQPLEGFGDMVHKYGGLLIVDTVVTIGSEPFFMDDWSIDVVYTGSQKVLGAPPGLSPISFSLLAERKIFSRKTTVPVFYWDMTLLGEYWGCFDKPRTYHHTISATLVYGLREALARIAEEGLEASWSRHKTAGKILKRGLALRGLQCFVKNSEYQLNGLVSIELPPGVDGKLVCEYAMKKYKVEISGGLGPTNGKVLRIGLLGVNASGKRIGSIFRALDDGLRNSSKSKL
ncbi:alanine--glyoxylate aminotransferase isoform X2 [Prorops nasuta]